MTRSRLPVRWLGDHLLASNDATWAWFSLPTVSYDFLSSGQRDALLAATTLALAGLSGSECHLLVLPDAYEVDRWAADLAGDRPESEAWTSYVDTLRGHLADGQFWRRRVYLGVALDMQVRGRRGGRRPGRRHGGEQALDAEVGRLRSKANTLQRMLAASALNAVPARAGEMRWLLQRAFWRGMAGAPPGPAPEGILDRDALAQLAESVILNGYRSLALRQDDSEVHLATLAAARFPDVMTHPGSEWLFACDALDFPVEASVRFRLVPPRQASLDAARKLAEASDQARHIAGTSSDLPLALIETTERARQLEYAVTKEGLPLVYGWPRFTVTAPDAEELDARVGELIEAHRDLGIELVRPGGDQFALFCEALPGDRVRVRSFEQRQALVTLAGGMFIATSDLGDRRGPYIGETTGRSRSPVHFDPLAAAQRNLPTAIAITGQPGGGKTHLAELMLYQLALRGTWALMIDPKNEAGGLADLPGLEHARILELGPQHEGLLDPYAVAEDAAQGALLAADVLRMLVPGDLSPEHEAAILAACRREADSLWPCLEGVTRRLAEGGPAAAQLAETVKLVSRFPLARLCFSRFGNAHVAPDGQLTILQMQGLSVPEAGTPTGEYTLADRLSVAVMYLVATFAGRLADASRAQAKAIVIDEAWALTASRQGRALVQRLSRTGRSKNTALVLVSQNAGDFLGPEVQNNFSAKFAFRSTQSDEVAAICRLLDLEPTPEHIQAVRTLANGECLFADLDNRVGTVHVDLVLDDLAAAFDTTPPAIRARLEDPSEGVPDDVAEEVLR